MVRVIQILFDYYNWYTAILIARSQLTKQYRDSYLGLSWMLLQPMAMMCVYVIIMPMLLKIKAADFALYLLATMPLWQFIANTLTTSCNSLIDCADTLKRCLITSSLFPLANVLKHTYSYFTAFASMAALAFILGLPISWHIFLWPIYFLPILVAILSVSIGLAYCAPYVRDIGEAIMVAMTIGMWGSAVIYPLQSLPLKVQQIIEWNPFYICLESAITLIYYHQIPGLLIVGKSVGVMCLGIVIGWTLYKLGRRDYVYYL